MNPERLPLVAVGDPWRRNETEPEAAKRLQRGIGIPTRRTPEGFRRELSLAGLCEYNMNLPGKVAVTQSVRLAKMIQHSGFWRG